MNEIILALAEQHRFRLRREEPANLQDTLRVIPCAIGGAGAHLYQHGPGMLAYTGASRGLRQRLTRIDGVRATQVGDAECTVVFPAALFPAVAAVVKPRRKRPGGPGNMEALRRAREAQAQGGLRGLGATIAPGDVEGDGSDEEGLV